MSHLKLGQEFAFTLTILMHNLPTMTPHCGGITARVLFAYRSKGLDCLRQGINAVALNQNRLAGCEPSQRHGEAT